MTDEEDRRASRHEEQTCDHCGLPLPRSWFSRSEDAEPQGPFYCCFGCRMAATIARGGGGEGAGRQVLTRLGLAVFFTMNVMAFTMALWSSDLYRATEGGSAALSSTFEDLFRYVVMLFATPVLFLLGRPLCENALIALGRGIFSTDLLLAAGVGASFAYSSVSVLRGEGPVYFEVGCVVLLMVTLGRWIEATGKQRANEALDRLARLMPETVRRVGSGSEEEISIERVRNGDLLHVLAGERIPADGRVTSGVAFVDDHLLTGESEPVTRLPGDPVLGGSMNIDGDLVIEVTAAGPEGTLARLIEMVYRARRAKGHYERLADRVSTWFVPVIAAIVMTTFAIQTFRVGFDQGLLQGLSVLLIACPCALGLATPLAVSTALGHAAGAQVLFRSGEAIERLATVGAVRFDKTGTLTSGEPALLDVVCEREAERTEVLRRARAVAASSTHVLCRTILRSTSADSADRMPVASEVQSIPGLGVAATTSGYVPSSRTYLGSRRLLERQGMRIGTVLEAASHVAEREGRSLSWVGWGGRARGLFLFRESLRPGTREAIARCRSMGLDVGVLTGDHAARGHLLEGDLGVPVEADLLPERKVAAIHLARKQFGPVVMVGDGVNDAPALAAGDIGVAMGCGTDLSREAAAVCLLGDNLERLPWAIDLARRTVRVIRGNLAWAFGYNTIGVGLAAGGMLNPALAALLMVGSSGFVILNTMRLKADRFGDPPASDDRSALERSDSEVVF